MNTTIPSHLVFTDMDGTLLDHHTYTSDAAQPMLKWLANNGVPVIPNTSKTFAELTQLRKQHGLDGPFIVENGAAIYIPHGFLPQKPVGAVWTEGYWCKSFTSPRSHWLTILERVKGDYEGLITHFAQMSTEDIIAATGLSEDDAKRAAQRQFSEPVLFSGDEQQKHSFIHAVHARGARTLEGGRFIHLCGDADKGQAMKWLAQTLSNQYALNVPPTTIALGDSGNDVAMLEQADIGIRIASPVRDFPELHSPPLRLIDSSLLGPLGWAETMSALFNQNP